MKKTIKGITYDTAFSIPLCTCTYQYGEEEVIETAYRTPMMQYFIFQRIGNGERSIKKTPGLLEAKECVRFQFLKEHQKEYNIQKACKSHVLDSMIISSAEKATAPLKTRR